MRAARRRNLLTQGNMVRPALLLKEGRNAALAGDTAAAVRAYQHYLRVRDRPDPGPMQEQVTAAKAHLSELLGERPGR